MIMTSRIKVVLIATFVLLVLLSASFFAYSRMSGKGEETRAAPSTLKETGPSVITTENKISGFNTSENTAKKVEDKASAKDEQIKALKGTTEAEAELNKTEVRTISRNEPPIEAIHEQDIIDDCHEEEQIEEKAHLEQSIIEDVSREEVEPSCEDSSSITESEELIENENFKEILVYEKSGTILSLDLSSQISKDFGLSTLMNQNGARFYDPKCSPDGKQIAFYMCIGYMDDRNGIYVMNLDGSNFRQISKSYSNFDFGQNGDSIVYFGDNRHQIIKVNIKSDGPLEPKIIESVEVDHSLFDIKCHGNYAYWIVYYTHLYRRAFDIRRKNMNDLSAESEIIYSDPGSVNFSVSPDGSHLLLAKCFGGSCQVIIVTTQTNSVVGPLIFEQNEVLEKSFWSLDGKWIYAERKGENPGLVRFKFDEISSGEPIKLQLVIPNFVSVSGALFVPTGLE